MSVLHCSRNGCENIMCDRLSYRYGYICNECFDELINTKGKILIHEFMESYKNDVFTIDQYEKLCENEFKTME